MNIYELNYTVMNYLWGPSNKSVYVKADNKVDALKIGKSLITDNISQIKVLRQLETIN